MSPPIIAAPPRVPFKKDIPPAPVVNSKPVKDPIATFFYKSFSISSWSSKKKFVAEPIT